MRTSRQIESGIEHFCVYPGREAEPDERVQAVCQGCAPIPMRWWNRKTSLSRLRRSAIWVREKQLTRFGFRTRRTLREIMRNWRIDLVHSNTAAIIDGARVAAELGLPHVWHIRERIGRDGFMRFPVSDQALVDRMCSLSTRVVAMSRFVAHVFHSNGQSAKTEVVYDGVDTRLFGCDDARARGVQLREAWGGPDDAVLIGKVAAVTSRVKRHELFIRAAAELARCDRSLRFAVIGPIPRLGSWARRQGHDYFVGLQQMVREHGLEDRFLWPGAVDDAPAVMNAIDILAHACDLEGFGRVAIEAMAARRPVVGPAAGGFAESVLDGKTGHLVTPGDPRTMADALAGLVADPTRRHKFGVQGQKRAAQKFSPGQHVASMMKVYQNALGA